VLLLSLEERQESGQRRLNRPAPARDSGPSPEERRAALAGSWRPRSPSGQQRSSGPRRPVAEGAGRSAEAHLRRLMGQGPRPLAVRSTTWASTFHQVETELGGAEAFWRARHTRPGGRPRRC